MTIKTKAKTDPKGGIKPVKKGHALSSSLASIMKSGGLSAGTRSGKSGGTERVTRAGALRPVTMVTSDALDDHFDPFDIKEPDSKKDEQVETKATGNVATFSGGQMMDKVKNDNHDTTMKVQTERDNMKTANKNDKGQETITYWENEILRIEKAVPKATSKERRESLEIQLSTAQMMLKQALLQVSAEYTTRMEEDVEIMDLTDTVVTSNKNHETNESYEGKAQENSNESDIEMLNERINWADVSDDDTVILNNQKNQAEEEWQTVQHKTIKKAEKQKNHKNESVSQDSRNLAKSTISNPYTNRDASGQEEKANDKRNSREVNGQSINSSLNSYLERAKHKVRNQNTNSIRVTMSFTPRTAGPGDLKRVARELLEYAMDFDSSIMLLPWDDNCDTGPINTHDLANPHTLLDIIKYYFDKPSYVNLQPGSPAYGIGVRFSTDLAKFEFINKWNIKKREYKQQNKPAYTINLAATQKSPKSFIISIAVGSTEDQDYELLNERLEKETGITGIEMSFQNINQMGITQEFWKIANKKANSANTDKMSREHLRTKYLWAPNALAIYVPQREQVNIARKLMIQKYGTLADGLDPVWPDGSSMRFLPIKGTTIHNEKTKQIVRKRLAFHIWLKANKVILDTNMVNIHGTIEAFEGNTFAETILNMTDETNNRVFHHFNRVWSNDPSVQKWSLSSKAHLAENARKILANIKDRMEDLYGTEIEQFFRNDTINSHWLKAATRMNQMQEDDDDWFDDEDDIDEMVKKGIVDSSFLSFLAGKVDDSDKQSGASWGTGDTTYTEICTTQETSSTNTSSITHDNSIKSNEEKQRCKTMVRDQLIKEGIPIQEVDDILDNKHPYELVFSGIHMPSWDANKEVFLIKAIRAQITTTDIDDDDLYD